MQPTFKVVVDGKTDITQKIADRLVELEVVDRAGVKSDRLTITIDDRDQLLEIPRTGVKLSVWLGYVGQTLVKIGEYAVDGVELSGPLRTMTISANAADMTSGIKAPKERSFHKVTFGDLVKRIAAEHKLQPSIAPKLASRALGHIDQTESDMQLLTRICADQGATMKVADGRLIIADRASGKTNSGQAMPVITIRADQCESWSATLQDRSKYQAVKAYWQDKGKSKRTGVTAGSGTPVMTLKNSYASAAEAEQAAASKLKALANGTASVRISGLIGDPTLTAEAIANLVGFRAGVDGSGWVIDQVTHRLGSNGYTNEVDIETKEGTTTAKVSTKEAVPPAKKVESKAAIKAELARVDAEWHAELDRSEVLGKQVDSLIVQAQQAGAAGNDALREQLLAEAVEKNNQTKAIVADANKKYSSRHDELKAML